MHLYQSFELIILESSYIVLTKKLIKNQGDRITNNSKDKHQNPNWYCEFCCDC